MWIKIKFISIVNALRSQLKMNKKSSNKNFSGIVIYSILLKNLASMIVNQHLLTEIKAIITQAKEKAIRAVDHERVLMYWHIGKRIFEEEQEGKDRADYGTYLIKYLAEQ